MVRQIVIEFRRNAAHLRQTVVRNIWEIMVLNVVSEIVDEEIERTIIAGGSLALGEQIVLRDEVSS